MHGDLGRGSALTAGMSQQMLACEDEYLQKLRASATTCVHRHAVDEAEEQLLLDMLGLVA